METLIKTVDLSVREPEEDGLPIGSLAGRWQIEHELGRGGMGIVYAVVHADIGKRAALKILHRRLFASSTHRDRTLTEARVVNQIDHPNIVDIFDTGTLPDGRSYIVMERLEGCSLAEHATRIKVLPDEAIAILFQICDALQAAHQVGVLHRDLKLDNVFLVDEAPPRIKLLDWGIAKVIAQEVGATLDGQLAGTPQFVSPEQARGAKLTPKSDVYSLGILAYQLFLETLPFESESVVEVLAMHLHAAPPLPRELWPDIPRPLEALLLAMLAKQPDDRPSLTEVMRRLEQIAAELRRRRSSAWEEIVDAAPPTGMPRAVRWIPPASTVPNNASHARARWRYAIGTLSLVALALLFAFVRDEGPESAAPPAHAPATATGHAPLPETRPATATPQPARAPDPTDLSRTARPHAPAKDRTVTASSRPAVKPASRPAPARPAAVAPPAARIAITPPAPPPPQAGNAAPVANKPPTADEVAAKYAAIGRRLADAPRQRDLSSLWSRYRRLQIQEALATPEKRATASQLLDELERDLARR